MWHCGRRWDGSLIGVRGVEKGRFFAPPVNCEMGTADVGRQGFKQSAGAGLAERVARVVKMEVLRFIQKGEG